MRKPKYMSLLACAQLFINSVKYYLSHLIGFLHIMFHFVILDTNMVDGSRYKSFADVFIICHCPRLNTDCAGLTAPYVVVFMNTACNSGFPEMPLWYPARETCSMLSNDMCSMFISNCAGTTWRECQLIARCRVAIDIKSITKALLVEWLF